MQRAVTVLGINDGHDSGAALLRDGKVLAAVQEERIRNIKNYSGTPAGAIKAVFEIAKVSPQEVDVIAIVSLNRTYAPLKETPLKVKLFEKISPFVHGHLFSKLYVKILHRFRSIKELRKIFVELGLDEKEVMFVEHHQAHAALAFYQRPLDEETLIFTLDGAGDGLCATVNIGGVGDIERIAATTYYDSPGNSFYSEITGYLGMKRWEHEYKVMGLAPYGKADYCIDKIENIIRINPKNPLEFQNTLGACGTQIQNKLRKMLSGQRFDNIAAASQLHFERIVTKWIENGINTTSIHKIACSGGSFLNVKANMAIREMTLVEDAFFYPTSDDGGTPMGAALEAYHRYCISNGIKPKRFPLEDLYFGREFDNDRLKNVLKENDYLKRAEYVDDIESTIADLILKGKVIARFNGREEWGPRALGNRSILADPRDLRVIRRINFAIKQRDFWMPFTPSILERRMDDYLVNAKPARYMIEAFDTTEKAEEIIAGLHPYDRTARPQTVNSWNPDYQKIIKEFEAATGVGGVLNTSFNLHGSPIVGNPEVAIQTFENSGLDALAPEN